MWPNEGLMSFKNNFTALTYHTSVVSLIPENSNTCIIHTYIFTMHDRVSYLPIYCTPARLYWQFGSMRLSSYVDPKAWVVKSTERRWEQQLICIKTHIWKQHFCWHQNITIWTCYNNSSVQLRWNFTNIFWGHQKRTVHYIMYCQNYLHTVCPFKDAKCRSKMCPFLHTSRKNALYLLRLHSWSNCIQTATKVHLLSAYWLNMW